MSAARSQWLTRRAENFLKKSVQVNARRRLIEYPRNCR